MGEKGVLELSLLDSAVDAFIRGGQAQLVVRLERYTRVVPSLNSLWLYH